MIPCPVCGQPMPAMAANHHPRLYCSRPCRHRGWTILTQLRNADVDEIVVDRLTHGETVHSTKGERARAVAILSGRGRSGAHIAGLLHVTVRTVCRLKRAGTAKSSEATP